MNLQQAIEIFDFKNLETEKITKEIIKIKYRELAKKFHPDVGGSESLFKEVTLAKNILNDYCRHTNIKEKQGFKQDRSPETSKEKTDQRNAVIFKNIIIVMLVFWLGLVLFGSFKSFEQRLIVGFSVPLFLSSPYWFCFLLNRLLTACGYAYAKYMYIKNKT